MQIRKNATAAKPVRRVVRRQCLWCREWFKASRSDARCCSGACRTALSRWQSGKSPSPSLAWQRAAVQADRMLQQALDELG